MIKHVFMGLKTLVIIIFKGLLEHWHYGVDFPGHASADLVGLLILVTHARIFINEIVFYKVN